MHDFCCMRLILWQDFHKRRPGKSLQIDQHRLLCRAGGRCTIGRSFATSGICSLSSKKGDFALLRMNCIPSQPISQSSTAVQENAAIRLFRKSKMVASIQREPVSLSSIGPLLLEVRDEIMTPSCDRARRNQFSAIRINATRRSGSVSHLL